MSELIHFISKRVGTVGERTVTFRLSTDSEDRAKDRVAQDGWKLKRYKQNPVVLWGHNHGLPAIGRMAKLRTSDGALDGDVQFATAEQHPFADTVFRLVDGGFINAGSVGFIPLKFSLRNDGGIDFNENELIEYSICNIPMNPDCLARAVESGINIAPLAKAVGAENAASYDELRAKLLASASNTPEPVPNQTPNLGALRNRAANLGLKVRLT